MTFKNISLLCASLILGFTCAYPATAKMEPSPAKDGVPRYVETKLITEFDSAIAGQPFTIAIDQTMVDGWHTYWKNPGDSGEATSIEWTLPTGWKADTISFPTPIQLPSGPLMNYGYGHHVTLLTSLHIPDNVKGDSATIDATITWLVCSDICVPETTHAQLVIPFAKNGQEPHAVNVTLFNAARKALPENVAWQGLIEEEDQNITLNFKTDPDTVAALEKAKDMYFYAADWGIVLYAAPQNISVKDDTLTLRLQRDSRALSDLTSLKGVFVYTTEDGSQKSVSIEVPIMGKSPAAASADTSLSSSSETPTTFFQALFLAFFGGIILNLMPCVFPVLSMKALSLIKMSEREQKHARLHGIIYTAGIQICFLGIAGLLIALQAAGEKIGWGFQLQHPTVVLLLAYLLFMMGLNLSGFFEFKSGFLSNIGHKMTMKHGYVGTFFTGMLATLVATPCTAPFMGAAMGYALTQPAALSLSVFAALGFGLAAPYLLLCFVPALRTALPKPGAWMEVFRQFMAFPLYASVAWLLWVYAILVMDNNALFLGLVGIILIAFTVWMARHTPRRQPWKTIIHALSITAVFFTLTIVILSGFEKSSDTDVIAQEVGFPSMPFTAEGFKAALAGNEPIFVDMTAAWCITCKVNEKVALSSDATQKLFAAKNMQVFVGDWTNKNAAITEFLRSHGRIGVPLYIYIGPRDLASGLRPDTIILPQLLTNGIIADAIATQ